MAGRLSPPPSTGLHAHANGRATRMELTMLLVSRRSLFASAFLLGLLPAANLLAADKPKEIHIDGATYNPVSILLKDKVLLEKDFPMYGICSLWIQTRISSNALRFFNAA